MSSENNGDEVVALNLHIRRRIRDDLTAKAKSQRISVSVMAEIVLAKWLTENFEKPTALVPS